MHKHKIIIHQKPNQMLYWAAGGKTVESYEVVCLESGEEIEILDPTPRSDVPEDMVERAVFYMDGKDGLFRCDGEHELVNQSPKKR